MLGTNRLKALLAAGALVVLGGCNSGMLDDGGSGDVVLLVQTLTVSPVTAARDTVTGACVFTVVNATGSLLNKPKNADAKSPYQDVVLQDVVVVYAWDDAFVTPTRVMNVSGTVPVGGSGALTFPPILLGDLDPSRAGHSANLTLTFRGHTVEGAYVASPPFHTEGAVLGVNSCI